MEFKLIVRKINGALSEKEKEIFDDWYCESEEHQIYFKRVQENYLKGQDIVDIQTGWETVSSKINPKIKANHHWKYAAAIAALLVLGSLLFIFNVTPESSVATTKQPVKINIPIPVGTDKAILTLQDG